MSARERWLTLGVASVRDEGDIRHLRLVLPDGGDLPAFTPGSHVVIDAGGLSNAYSLTGEFVSPRAYEVSVLRVDGGDGGSRWLHAVVEPGDRLAVSPPRSMFAPLASARHHVLIAGGIGVTPIVSHARAAVAYGRSFEVIYGHRPEQPALLDELAALCGDGRLRVATDRRTLAALVTQRLGSQPLGTIAYVCGPRAMMDAVLETARSLGWPAERVHTEAFSSSALDPGEPFVVDLRDSGRSVRVESGVSLLQALEASGIAIASMCRQGVCGECRVAVCAGTPLHRDLYLSEDERDAGDTLMCCVSRAVGDRLELAL